MIIRLAIVLITSFSLTLFSCSVKTKVVADENFDYDMVFSDGLSVPFTGRCIQYFPNSKKLLWEAFYDKGIPEGISRTYFIDGSVKIEGYYHKGQISGNWNKFDKKGNIEFSINYLDGELDGEYLIYHSNGKVKEMGMYQKNQPVGLWKEFDTSGIVIDEKQYN